MGGKFGALVVAFGLSAIRSVVDLGGIDVLSTTIIQGVDIVGTDVHGIPVFWNNKTCSTKSFEEQDSMGAEWRV